MRKMFGKRAAILALAVMMVMPQCSFAFAQDSTDADVANDNSSEIIIALKDARELEMPQAPDEKPAVMFNGEYVEFTDAKPVNINGRVMVPFRAIFETIGADVDYDNETKEITAVLGEKSVSFRAGSSELTVTDNDKTEKTVMDVVPFTDAYTKRTYVSSRFVAEALGYSVSWDNTYKTVVIIDFEPIIKEASEKMSVIGLLFRNNKVDVTKPYRTSGNFDMNIMLGEDAVKILKGQYAEAEPVNIKISGEIDGTVQGKSGITNEMTADIKMALDLNEKDLVKVLELSDTAQGNLLELVLSDLSMDIKMDGENMYIKAPVLNYLLLGMNGDDSSELTAALPAAGEDIWYKMPMSWIFDTYEDMGIDFEQLLLMAQNVNSFEGYLNMLAAMFTEVGESDINTYYTLRMGAIVLNELVGDEAFKTSRVGSAYTHTLNFDMNSFIELAKAIGEEDAAQEITDELSDMGVDFSINITLREKNEALENYTFRMDISSEDMFELAVDESGNFNNETANISMKIGNYLDFSMKSNANTENTSKLPDVSLPGSAQIIDFAELMK